MPVDEVREPVRNITRPVTACADDEVPEQDAGGSGGGADRSRLLQRQGGGRLRLPRLQQHLPAPALQAPPLPRSHHGLPHPPVRPPVPQPHFPPSIWHLFVRAWQDGGMGGGGIPILGPAPHCPPFLLLSVVRGCVSGGLKQVWGDRGDRGGPNRVHHRVVLSSLLHFCVHAHVRLREWGSLKHWGWGSKV